MSAKRKDPHALDPADAKTKLERLLDTERELELMLDATRQDAKELVEEARRVAAERARDLDKQITEEDARLRRKVIQERDQAIAQIQTKARALVAHLDGLDAKRIEALAEDVLERLFGLAGPRGAS